MGLHWPGHSWVFPSDFTPSSFLWWIHHEISWCLPLLRRSQTWRFCRACCIQSGIACTCKYAACSTSWWTISGIYTLLKSARGHASGMSFLIRLAHCSDGLHCFYCAWKRVPDRGWTARRILLPLSSCKKWQGWFLTIECFWKVPLFRISLPRFPWARTSHISPCRTFLQSPIPGCRLVLPTSLVRREEESFWVFHGPYNWRRLIQRKSEGNGLVMLVVW